MSLANLFYSIVLLFSFFYMGFSQEVSIENAPANITFYIEHSFGDNQFSPRTRIQLVYKQDGRQGLLYLDKNLIANDDMVKFKGLIKKKGLYTIRLRTEKENWQSHFVLSSIPVCELQSAGFKEDIQAFLDGTGNIIGISYSVPPMTIAQECDISKIKDTISVQTRIKLGEEITAQIVPVQAQAPRPPFLQNIRLGLEEEKKQTQQQQGSQSFLQKYWYIVLAMVLYMFMSGGGEAGKDKPAAKKE